MISLEIWLYIFRKRVQFPQSDTEDSGSDTDAAFFWGGDLIGTYFFSFLSSSSLLRDGQGEVNWDDELTEPESGDRASRLGAQRVCWSPGIGKLEGLLVVGKPASQ